MLAARFNDDFASGTDYVDMPPAAANSGDTDSAPLTPLEIARLRSILSDPKFNHHTNQDEEMSTDTSYPEFRESTHAWAIFADNPDKTKDRIIGTVIIFFQLFTYWLFAAEAIEDYQRGAVEVMTSHEYCLASGGVPEGNLVCEAEHTNELDAFVSFSMLGIFLANDVQQAARALRNAGSRVALAFAILAAVEVISCFLSASVSISQKLYIGEVTDAVEVGVGLLFIRELSTMAYRGIRQKSGKAYIAFIGVLAAMVMVGLLVHPICEALFAP